jgi:HlyD family secretion protein
MRLNPQNVQNVVTYNVVIDVSNPKQKLKPGMTANLTITIDERNNVLKVPNAALRFTPQATTGQQAATTQATTGNASGQDSRQGARQRAANASNANAASVAGAPADNGAQPSGSPERRIASPTSPVLSGQMRRIWVLGQDGQPQSREIQVGLTDGAATEVVEGNLQEGEIVITGQNITGQSKPQSNQTAPGFGGAPRGGGAPAGGGRRG